MKKKMLFCLAILSFAFMSVFGQTRFSGSMELVKKAGSMNVKLDYSEAMIHGMTEEEYSIYEVDWNKDKPQVLQYLMSALQKQTVGYLFISPFKKAPFTMYVRVLSVDLKGNTYSEVTIVDEKNQEVASIHGMYADGGRFGTGLNLIKDGAEHTGYAIGRILKKELKKNNKNNK